MKITSSLIKQIACMCEIEVHIAMCFRKSVRGMTSQFRVRVPLREEEDPRADPHAVYGGGHSSKSAVGKRGRLLKVRMQHPRPPLLLWSCGARYVARSARSRDSATARSFHPGVQAKCLSECPTGTGQTLSSSQTAKSCH